MFMQSYTYKQLFENQKMFEQNILEYFSNEQQDIILLLKQIDTQDEFIKKEKNKLLKQAFRINFLLEAKKMLYKNKTLIPLWNETTSSVEYKININAVPFKNVYKYLLYRFPFQSKQRTWCLNVEKQIIQYLRQNNIDGIIKIFYYRNQIIFLITFYNYYDTSYQKNIDNIFHNS